MKLRHYLDELGCHKKLNFDLLRLTQNESKERFYGEFFEFMILSMNLSKKTYSKHFKSLLDRRYRDIPDENLNEEIKSQVFELFARMRDFFIASEVTILRSGFSFSVEPKGRLSASCHALIKRDGVVEGIIFSSKKPIRSLKGRKFDTRVDTSLELLGLLKKLKDNYPAEADLKASFYHLRNRNDTFGDLKPFNEKDGNIVTLSMSALKKKHKLKENVDFNEYFSSVFTESQNQPAQEKDCESCRYKVLCKVDEIGSKPSLEEVLSPTLPSSINLNTKQMEILKSLNGRIGISAVPGSGKTRVITEGIKKLCKDRVDPKAILALTFTNKATEELRKRVGREDVRISSYNAFGYSLIREYYAELGFKTPPRLVTQYQKYEILKEILKGVQVRIRHEYLFHPEYGSMKEMINALDRALFLGDVRLSPLLEIEMYRYEDLRVKSDFLSFLPIVAKSYLWELKSKNLICYEQQIDLVLELFKKNPLVLDSLKNQYEYVFLDEYQDTNQKQHEMVMKFAVNNVFMVGDEDQSIYGFRGSEPQNFLSFLKTTERMFYLEENYRSSRAVVDFANDFIVRNPSRLDKRILCSGTKTGAVGHHLSDAFMELVRDLGERYSFKDIAIITRKNKVLNELGNSLKNAGYPVSKKNNLLKDRDFLLFKAYLNCILGTGSKVDAYLVFKHVYKTPEHLLSGDTLNGLSKSGHPHFESFLNDQKEMSGGDIQKIQKIFSITRGHETVCNAVIDLYESQFMLSLGELCETIEQMILIEEPIHLPTESNGINLLTGHTCKGLEFKAVIVYDFEAFSPRTPRETEEENRLLYVAFTRAENELHIIHLKKEGRLAL